MPTRALGVGVAINGILCLRYLTDSLPLCLSQPMASVLLLAKHNRLPDHCLRDNIYICLTLLTRAKPKDKMEFPA